MEPSQDDKSRIPYGLASSGKAFIELFVEQKEGHMHSSGPPDGARATASEIPFRQIGATVCAAEMPYGW